MPEHGLSSAYRLEDGLAVGFGVGAGVAVGLDVGLGEAVGARRGRRARDRRRARRERSRSPRASRWRAGVAAADVAVGTAVSTSPRTAPVGTRRDGCGQDQAAVGDDERDRQQECSDQSQDRPGDGRADDPRHRNTVERFGHGHRAPHVARAVDVSAGQADELLLAQRLGHRPAEGRASVRLIRCLDGDAEAIAIVDRSEERADPLVGRGFVHRPAIGACDRPRGRPGIVHPDGMGLLGRRRIVLHARSSLPPGAATARSLVPFAPCRFAQGGARLRRLSRRERRRRSESRVPTQPWPSRSP